jgi:hypothetical protein
MKLYECLKRTSFTTDPKRAKRFFNRLTLETRRDYPGAKVASGRPAYVYRAKVCAIILRHSRHGHPR